MRTTIPTLMGTTVLRGGNHSSHVNENHSSHTKETIKILYKRKRKKDSFLGDWNVVSI